MYYRLTVVSLEVPPLRERLKDFHQEEGVNVEFPKIVKIRQKFSGPVIGDVATELAKISRPLIEQRVTPGMKIAIAVGSRGIANIALMVKALCATLSAAQAYPFIIPAMGSHGGATADGQKKVLATLGITEESIGHPIVSSMETVIAGHTPQGVPVHLDREASQADGIVLINRIKAHTDFKGDWESGLLKQMTVGLGKHKGCTLMHTHGLRETIPEAAQVILQSGKILFGIAILENAREETAELVAVLPDEMLEKEKTLLLRAKQLMAKLPFNELDVLVVDQIGKFFSGTGMDTNVIGRIMVPGEPEPASPKIKRIVALDLAHDSYGNALGIGLADLTTKKLVEKIDFQAMFANLIPTGYLERGKIPVTLENDREAVATALKTIGPTPPGQARLVRIKNTLHLEEMYISEALLPAATQNPSLEIVGQLVPMTFNASGDWIYEEERS
ncbi:lactate racemase domain-containing protein [Zhaonella formicivorans]|uniref:lactate racemase domain-containing protein n=1 Tax=Zhaonella formicivorans TaxID=2528593 RepID=UPI001D1082E1|nr:lactate racemase domain-containing protein [Zhaonella formicivorans]